MTLKNLRKFESNAEAYERNLREARHAQLPFGALESLQAHSFVSDDTNAILPRYRAESLINQSQLEVNNQSQLLD